MEFRIGTRVRFISPHVPGLFYRGYFQGVEATITGIDPFGKSEDRHVKVEFDDGETRFAPLNGMIEPVLEEMNLEEV